MTRRGAGAADGRRRGGLAVSVQPGSGVMMLTGGVDAADGNSALVGLPVGIDGGSAAISPVPAAAIAAARSMTAHSA